MGAKGEKTKQLICESAFCLFAEKGFKDVTMKDICERTKLSRGGLYRHYESTSQIDPDTGRNDQQQKHNYNNQ